MILPAVSLGTDTPLGAGGGFLGTRFSTIGQLLNPLLRNSLTFIGLIFLVLVIAGGISYLIAAGSGNTKNLQKSQQTLVSALIGFLVVFSAYFIIQIVEIITGLQILNPSSTL